MEVGSAEATDKQTKDFFFCYFQQSNSVLVFWGGFFLIKYSFAPLQTCWDKSGVLLLLAPFH